LLSAPLFFCASYYTQQVKIFNSTTKPTKVKLILIFLTTLLFFQVTAQYQQSLHHLDKREELEILFEPICKNHVQTSDFPGIVYAVVKDSQIFLEKGYGFTDFQKTKKVSADSTIFFIASNSKLFVTTAVMQLVEQGKIKLNDDINKYFKGFAIKNQFGKKITVENLITHTSGLEDHMIGAEVPQNISLPSLNDFYKQQTPRVVIPPGTEINYSNLGMGLTACMVENVSGMPFYKYAQKFILSPLKMNHSSYIQPVPDYLANNKSLQRFSHPKVLPYPVATLVTTANDMAHFMIAQLNEGKYEDTQLLQSNSVMQMQSRHFSANENIPGVCYGFFQTNINGYHAIYHTGSLDNFSIVFLLPSEKTGIYIAMSGNEDESKILSEMIKKFMDYYFPDTTKKLKKSLVGENNASLRISRPSSGLSCSMNCRTFVEQSSK
jgi:CubicO group peptidase (beta-lactamase class C family)